MPLTTIYELHQTIINSKNAEEASAKLGVSSNTIHNWVRYTLYHGKSLSFSQFKQISLREGLRAWGDNYNFPIRFKLIHPETIPFSKIHKAVRENPTDHYFVLSTRLDYLKEYLSKITYKGEGLTIKKLIELTPEQMREEMQERYDQVVTIPEAKKTALLSVAEIHREILASKFLMGAAKKLNFKEGQYLARHLGAFSTPERIINYEFMKSISVEYAQRNAIQIWGMGYDEPMVPPKSNLYVFSLAKLHEVILRTGSISKAGLQFGMLHNVFASFLKSLSINGEKISYEKLKVEYTAEEAHSRWGTAYTNPISEIVTFISSNFTTPSLPNQVDEQFASGSTIASTSGSNSEEKNVFLAPEKTSKITFAELTFNEFFQEIPKYPTAELFAQAYGLADAEEVNRIVGKISYLLYEIWDFTEPELRGEIKNLSYNDLWENCNGRGDTIQLTIQDFHPLNLNLKCKYFTVDLEKYNPWYIKNVIIQLTPPRLISHKLSDLELHSIASRLGVEDQALRLWLEKQSIVSYGESMPLHNLMDSTSKKRSADDFSSHGPGPSKANRS